ncbi:MAG: bifunctional salicylyl-CoA 5-hydroxylase/oxidoreductase [Anaerolineae bacterium]
MKIVCIGGGPAGLYFAILMKQVQPDADIQVLERNQPDDTFGWGVVFSAETLGTLREADPVSFAEIERAFITWDDIDTHVGGQVIRSTGHGFCGLSRKRLLQILHERCLQLGVGLTFQREVEGVHEFPDADLIVACDGINSRVREAFADHFQPHLDWRRCKFTWLGTDRPMDAFTFLFEERPEGLVQAHAYPFEPGLGTFIVEMRDEVWRAAGLDAADEAATLAYCQEAFADFLGGHRLLVNRSLWRTFPTVTCQRWVKDHIVLMGDAVHTAHFSIGSGTKLAMEDAIALAETFRDFGPAQSRADAAEVLLEYEDRRWVDVLRTQKAAQTSLEWFEEAARYIHQPPLQFTFNLMSRSKRITWDNMRNRDRGFMEAVRAEFWEREAGPLLRVVDGSDGSDTAEGPSARSRAAVAGSSGRASAPTRPPGFVGTFAHPYADRPAEPMFAPFQIRGLRLVNRVVVSPMCQYLAEEGMPDDWHLVHLGSRALGGAGLLITEMTDVSPEGRISRGCAGMYTTAQRDAWSRVVTFVHRYSQAAIGLQLGHAGRKGSTCLPWEDRRPDAPLAEDGWDLLAASAIPFRPGSPTPKAMDRADMEQVITDHVRAARYAQEAGFDLLEIHAAHGYLLSSFISPLSNRRTDEYGGDVAGRMRFPLEVFHAVREAWPAEKPISVRISATDWVADGGLDGDGAVAVARLLKEAGADLIDVSAGQTSAQARPVYGRMYQVPFSDRIRHEVGIPTIAVGAIQGADHANTVLAAGRADLCALARPHLADPYLTLHAAAEYGYWDQEWPQPYEAVQHRPARSRDRRSDSLRLPRPAFRGRRED